MTTSGSYSFNCTRDDIIRDAMLNLGHLGVGDNVNPQETVDLTRRLNMLVKQWQGKADFAPGLKTWNRRIGYAFLSGTTGTYQVGPTNGYWTNSFISTTTTAQSASGSNTITLASVVGITLGDTIGVQVTTPAFAGDTLFWSTVSLIVGNVVTLAANLPGSVSSGYTVFDYTTNAQLIVELETVNLRDYTGEDTILDLLNVQQYQALPSKSDPTNISDPTAVYVERRVGYNLIYTDCAGAQDITKYLVIEYMEPAQDIINPLDNPEFPQEWFLALVWGLTREVAPQFGAQWTTVMQENYADAILTARNMNPVSYADAFFQPGKD